MFKRLIEHARVYIIYSKDKLKMHIKINTYRIFTH